MEKLESNPLNRAHTARKGNALTSEWNGLAVRITSGRFQLVGRSTLGRLLQCSVLALI